MSASTPIRRTTETSDREWYRNAIYQLSRDVHEGMTNLADLRRSLLLDLLRGHFPSAASAHILVAHPHTWTPSAAVTRVIDASGRDMTATPSDRLGDDGKEINELILALFPDYRSSLHGYVDDGPITEAGEEYILDLEE